MDDHARGLVDGRHPLVEMKEVERNLLGIGAGAWRLRHSKTDERARPQFHRGPGHDAIHPHRALVDRAGEKRAALPGKLAGQKHIEAKAGRSLVHRPRHLFAGLRLTGGRRVQWLTPAGAHSCLSWGLSCGLSAGGVWSADGAGFCDGGTIFCAANQSYHCREDSRPSSAAWSAAI